ncbi:MAG TPA: TIGR04282 family arsenosugar biosynthesis glycosyltransferase [Gemmatimonadales bacterium]|nr:TIGR04282 family arsenosugar biosynthesis glycosyltransferase [Gemmatimonadales bacterium]
MQRPPMRHGRASPIPPGRTVLIFARAPSLGRVKTRLAAELGPAAALAIYRSLGLRTVTAARGVPEANVVVYYTPARARAAVAAWLGRDLELRPQRPGSLGRRMAAAVTDAVRAGAREVVVIGTDCPELDSATIARGFEALATCDVVLGPAHDGGYYLVGLRAPHPEIFENIPWSSPDTLRATLGAAARAGLHVALLEQRRDVDTAADWRHWTAVHPEVE